MTCFDGGTMQDKGMVCVTGCCHQGILTFADFAAENIVGGDNMYGFYGGLHIAPFGPVNPEREYLIKGMGNYNFKKIARNHCTGLAAVKKMVEFGYPMVKGTARYGSKRTSTLGMEMRSYSVDVACLSWLPFSHRFRDEYISAF